MTVTTRLGQVLRDDSGVRLEFARDYDEPVDTVWEAITDSERLGRWLGRWSGDPATGTVEFLMTAETDARPEPVRIDECVRPRRLAVTLSTVDGPWPLTVDLRERDGGGTTLHFVHHLAEPYDASGLGPGWHYYLDRLDAVLAGAPLPDRWDDYYPGLSDAYSIPDPARR